MDQMVARLILMMMLGFLTSNWVSLGVYTQLLEMKTVVGLVCSTVILHTRKRIIS